MFFLVPAYPGCPGQTAIKWLLLYYSSHLQEIFKEKPYYYLLLICVVYSGFIFNNGSCGNLVVVKHNLLLMSFYWQLTLD